MAFTAAVWWLARRDLASRPAPPTPAASADARELEQLCVTLEALVTELTARMETVEQRLQEVAVPLAAPSLGAAPSSGVVTVPVPVAAPAPMAVLAPMAAPTPVPAPMPSLGISSLLPMPPAPMAMGAAPKVGTALPQEAAEPEVAAHAPLYALLDAGITDPAEITRRTGLGRGEVDLILSLRARRAL